MTDLSKEFEKIEGVNKITERKENLVTSDLSEDMRIAIDVSVATAKQYPRDLPKVLKNILFLATQDKETAENCFYSVTSEDKIIRGASIRLAEIITTCYGNIRSSAKMISNDGKIITVQGACWDLENNVAYSIDVVRSIVDKSGKQFSEDRQILESMSACSIALRNAIFKVVPVAITSRIQNEIKKIVVGESADFETIRKDTVDGFIKQGVSERQILAVFNKKTVDELTRDDIFDLRGISTAIKEKYTTLEQAFSINKKSAISKASNKLGDLPITPNNTITENPTTGNVANLENGNDILGINSNDSDNKKPYDVKITSVTDEKGNELSPSMYGLGLVKTEKTGEKESEQVKNDLFTNQKNN